MVHLAAWLAVCSVLAIWLIRSPALTVLVAALIVLAVPSWDSHIVTGMTFNTGGTGIPSLMPVAWFLVVAILVRLIFVPETLLTRLRPQRAGLIMLCVAAVWALISTVTVSGMSGLASLTDELVAPICLLLLASQASRPRDVRRLQQAVVGLGVAEALLALTEYLAGHDIGYVEPANVLREIGASTLLYRASGTMDHPLTLAVLLLLALGCSTVIPRRTLRTGVRLILVAGIAASGSRVATVGALVLLLAVPGRSLSRRQILAGIGLVGAVGILLVATPVGHLLAARNANDLGSAGVRVAAYRAFGHIVHSYLLFGGGIGSSFGVATQLTGLQASFESPFIMWTVDIGLWGTVLLVGGLCALCIARGARGALVLTALLCLVVELTYSSFATNSSAGIVLALAIGVARSSRDDGRFVNVSERRRFATDALAHAAAVLSVRDSDMTARRGQWRLRDGESYLGVGAS